MSNGQAGFWDFEDRLRRLSERGDPLEKLAATVDFELFRPELTAALGPRDPAKGGRPGFDPVLKFRMLVLQAMQGLSLEQTEYLVADRLSWGRFCGHGSNDPVPDANTLWDFREALIAAGALEALFARWTLKVTKAKPAGDDKPLVDIAIPAFGYKSHISIDRRHGIIRRGIATHAAAHDGARLREGLIDPNNTASAVWADSAYRSKANEAFLEKIGKVSHIHRKKPKGKPMLRRTARANAAKSKVRAHVEHPFAHMKGIMDLTIRTIGLKRAEAAITLANMAYNIKRWCWLERKHAAA